MVGKKTFDILVSLGMERIESVQKTTLEKMKQILGETGVYIWNKSNAICNSEVSNYREQKSMSCERTFSETVSNKKILNAKLVKMVEELTFDLRKQKKYVSCVGIKIRYFDFETHTYQATLNYTNDDDDIIKTVSDLFFKSIKLNKSVRLVGVKFSNLSADSFQISLFDNSFEKQKLYKSLDIITTKFGISSISITETMH